MSNEKSPAEILAEEATDEYVDQLEKIFTKYFKKMNGELVKTNINFKSNEVKQALRASIGIGEVGDFPFQMNLKPVRKVFTEVATNNVVANRGEVDIFRGHK